MFTAACCIKDTATSGSGQFKCPNLDSEEAASGFDRILHPNGLANNERQVRKTLLEATMKSNRSRHGNNFTSKLLNL